MQMLTPNLGLLSKLGTIAQIVDEAGSVEKIDIERARNLLADREVTQWLDAMHREGLLAERVKS